MVIRKPNLLAVAALLLLGACDNRPSPLQLTPARAGADKSAPVTRSLPPAVEQRYDPAVVPDNEEKGMRVGGAVTTSGGQQAQKEKERKERAALEADQARQRQELARQQSIDAKVSAQ
jgi:hypothetical protein